jgi:hypothetical protein
MNYHQQERVTLLPTTLPECNSEQRIVDPCPALYHHNVYVREPSISHFLISPPVAFLRVEIDHQMKMVAHDGIRIDSHCKVAC